MTIDYLIEELQQLKEKHGNLEVTMKIWNEIWGEYLQENIEDVEVIFNKAGKGNGEKVVSLLW